jgi:integrase/recombinase XerD
MQTFMDLLNDFLQHSREHRFSGQTMAHYRRNLRRFIRWLETTTGAQTADQLRRAHLDKWLRHLQAHQTRWGRPLKPTSLNGFLADLRTFLRFLAARGYVQRSLADAVQLVRVPKLLPQSVLTHAQVKKILSRIPTGRPDGFRDRAMLELLYSSGVRASELVGLNLADVDLKNRTALVTGKGEKQRIVPLGRTAARHLESYLVAVRPYLVHDPALQAVFLDHFGCRLSYPVLLKRVHRYADELGFETVITPHTFRRSCATELIRGGANIYHVKELMGHETLNTLRHYTRLTILDLKKTHEKCHPREKDEV